MLGHAFPTAYHSALGQVTSQMSTVPVAWTPRQQLALRSFSTVSRQVAGEPAVEWAACHLAYTWAAPPPVSQAGSVIPALSPDPALPLAYGTKCLIFIHTFARYNLCTLKSTCFKCTIEWGLALY